MTEYTLGQVIDKIGRNPNLKFRFVNNEDYYKSLGIIVHLREDGYLANSSNETLTFSLKDKFTLVNEPVSIKEAFKAFEQGKNIYCMYKGERCDYIPLFTAEDNALEDEDGDAIMVGEILHGKWFIEEGN